MNYKNGVIESQMIRAELTKEQKSKAKMLARQRHMTFSGWVGHLIENELSKAETKPEASK